MDKCKFDKSWVGRCNKPTEPEAEYCSEHLIHGEKGFGNDSRCCVCGSQATHDCGETFQFVCGAPLCDSEECKIKHHPKNYRFTPRRWAEIYKIEINENLFETTWHTEIPHDGFLNKATLGIKEAFVQEIFEALSDKEELVNFGGFIVHTDKQGRRFKITVEVNL